MIILASKGSVISPLSNWWMNLRIQQKLIALIILLILLPLGGVGAYSSLVLRPQVADSAITDINSIADEVSNRFESKVNDSIEVLRIIDSSSQVKDYIAANKTERLSLKTGVRDLFKTIALHTFGIAQVRLLNASGWEVVRTDVAPGFIYSGDDNPSELTVVTEENLQNKGSRGYFLDTKALPEGSIYISDLDLNREQGKVQKIDGKVVPVLRYATPIYKDDKFDGILILNYYFQSVFDDVVNAFIDIFDGMDISIVQNTGEFLFSTGPYQWTAKANSDEDDTTYETIFDIEKVPPSVFTEGNSYESSNSLFVSSKININFSREAFVIYSVIKVPLSSIFASIDNQILISFIITLAVAIVSILIVGFSMKYAITDPIQDIVDEARKIAEGELRASLDRSLERQDEIGVLSHQFVTMQGNLNSFVKNIKNSTLTFTEYMEQLFLASQEVRNITRDTTSSFNKIGVGIDRIAEQNSEVNVYINDFTDLVLSVVSQMEETVELIREINEEVTFIALNAQIEAARVGAVGRGFMIVASSIRDLAKNTKSQLKNMQNNMKLIKEKVDTSVSEINTNVESFTNAAKEVVEISKSSEDQLNTQFAIFMEMANTITRLNTMAQGLLDSTKVFSISE